MSFYNNFVCLCVRNDISPSAAAIEMGFKKSNVTYWKNGRTPSDASLVKIANYFHVTVDELVGDSLPGEKKKPSAISGELVGNLPEDVQKLIQICRETPGLASDLLSVALRIKSASSAQE